MLTARALEAETRKAAIQRAVDDERRELQGDHQAQATELELGFDEAEAEIEREYLEELSRLDAEFAELDGDGDFAEPPEDGEMESTPDERGEEAEDQETDGEAIDGDEEDDAANPFDQDFPDAGDESLPQDEYDFEPSSPNHVNAAIKHAAEPAGPAQQSDLARIDGTQSTTAEMERIAREFDAARRIASEDAAADERARKTKLNERLADPPGELDGGRLDDAALRGYLLAPEDHEREDEREGRHSDHDRDRRIPGHDDGNDDPGDSHHHGEKAALDGDLLDDAFVVKGHDHVVSGGGGRAFEGLHAFS
ncbi:hypothetical protein ATCC90586_000210 [Pythium insidiosum]|nr:hypothetical protein ATCC90586_000210 [Pythium insidiosum]